jgi:DNA polymerase-4
MGAINHHRAQAFTRENSSRLISYMNIPTFSLAIESLLDPSLQNRPVVLASPFVKESRIFECSEIAQQAGIKKGMLLSQAIMLCSDVRIVESRDEVYQRVATSLEADIQKMIPVFEREKKGQGYLDYTGFETVYGNAEKFHQELRKKVQFRYSLNADIGISCNKLVSKMAAKSLKTDSSDYLSIVGPSDVKSFLAPLPVEFLPIVSEINKRQREGRWDVLDDLNLMFIEDVQRLPLSYLEVAFGKMGRMLHEFSHGVDLRPVVPIEKKRSLFFDVEFPEETNNCRLIFGELADLIDKGIHQLQNEKRVADSCEISLKYTTGDFKTFKIKSKEPIFQKSQIQKELLSIMEKIGERRLAIKWIQVEFLNVQTQGIQLSLFEQKTEIISSNLREIENRFPGKILNFNQKLRPIKKR